MGLSYVFPIDLQGLNQCTPRHFWRALVAAGSIWAWSYGTVSEYGLIDDNYDCLFPVKIFTFRHSFPCGPLILIHLGSLSAKSDLEQGKCRHE